MSPDTTWSRYLSARRAALGAGADPGAHAAHIDRAAARLKACLGIESEEARVQARRCIFFAVDAIFHEQLIASGDVGLLCLIAERIETSGVSFERAQAGGLLAVSLHYGLATSMLPLSLAMASSRRKVAKFAVINDSRRDPSSKPSARRLDRLNDFGCDFTDIDLATAGELGAMRQALRILQAGGIVLIFADGQVAPRTAKRAIACRLGLGSVAFPHGVAWLAQKAEVPIAPVVLRPKGDGNQIASGDIHSARDAQAAIQALVNMAIPSDPAPWRFWCSTSKHF